VRCLLLSLFLSALLVFAAQQTGTVRAADHFVPGAKITARQGDTKEVTYTDENGRYALKLAPGVWDVDVEMLGFMTAHGRITVGENAEPVAATPKDWTLEMPRYGQPAAALPNTPPAPDSAKPAAPSAGRTRQPGQYGRGRGFATRPNGASGATASARGANSRTAGTPDAPKAPGTTGGLSRGGFQSASVTETPEGQDALAQAAFQASNFATFADQPEDAFLVIGSASRGLAAASDDEARRQRGMAGGGGGPAGPGSPGGGGGPGGLGGDISAAGLESLPGISVTSDSLGLGGLGASGINAGFGRDNPVVGIGGPGRGPGGLSGGPGGEPGGRGGGGGGGRGAANQNRRGPYNGRFASFGNRRRTRPQYTGSVFINLNNSVLNAAPFSLNGKPAPKPSYDQARFGANFGGPLIIPKMPQSWQRSSFFITYQGAVSRNPYSQIASVPTAAERGGDFSQLLAGTSPIVIYNPATGLPFRSNVIPPSLLDPHSPIPSIAANAKIVQGLLSYIPLPTYSGVVQNYRNVTSVPSNNGNLGVRLNTPLSTKDRLNFNVQFQDRNSENEQLFGFRDPSTGTGLSASAGWSQSFAPRFNNSATLTFSRNNSKTTPYFAYTNNVASELGITGTSQAPIDYGPPNLSFTNFGSLSDASATLTRNQTTAFTDAVNYTWKRKHNFQFGFFYRRLQQNALTDQNARGSFSFSGLLTSELNAQGQPVSGTGFDFADFLLGLPQSSTLRFGDNNNYFRGWAMGGYAQDDYRLSRGLTLNIGVRYEYFTPYTELYGHLANLDLNSTFTAASIVTPGEVGPYSGALPSSLVRPEKTDFSPRFGFAWRPSQKRNLVVRGGYSIFYTSSPYAQIATHLASQPPFATTASLSTSAATPLSIENGFPTISSEVITNTYAINPNFRLPYAQTWSFVLQNTFPHGFLVEVEDIGTKGTDLGIAEQPNRSLTESVLNAQSQLQIANATGFNYQTSGANSIFNAGQVRVTRRFATGMSATLLYTRSKSIDDASSFNGIGGTTVQYIDNLALERGLSTFDQRNQLSFTYLLSSPVGVHGMMRNGGWKTAVLAGWTMQGTITAASGRPLTAAIAGNLSNTGGIGALSGSRAEATGLPIAGGDNPYFNPAAFTTPPAGQFGDAGRDTIPGPFRFSTNAALNRAWRFGESRHQLQLRLSAINALNHVVVTGFGTTVNSSIYGLATSASSARVVTLLLRFSF
jgi:carboxypeptidase family protein